MTRDAGFAAGGNACKPVILGIGADSGHYEQRSPSTRVATDARGCPPDLPQIDCPACSFEGRPDSFWQSGVAVGQPERAGLSSFSGISYFSPPAPSPAVCASIFVSGTLCWAVVTIP
jgi:hypothetical protein